jgi:hypothetical protein
MRLFLLVATCATLTAVATALRADDLALQQRPMVLQNAETLLLKDSAPVSRRTSPEALRAGMLASQEREVSALYAQLFDSLQLNYQQADEVVRLVAERTLLTSSWSTGSVEHSALPADHQLVRDSTSRIEALLGPEGFKQLVEYEKTLAERFQLRRLVTLLITVGHPLTSEQTMQLVAILAAERRRLDPTQENSPPGTLAYAEGLVRSFDDLDQHVEQLFGSVLSLNQREFAARYFAGRAQRRHTALDRYRKALAEGDNSYGFVYPAD